MKLIIGHEDDTNAYVDKRAVGRFGGGRGGKKELLFSPSTMGSKVSPRENEKEEKMMRVVESHC